MKKVFIVASLLLVLTGCGGSKKEEIDNTNINIEELPDVKGNENVKVDENGDKTNISGEFSKEKKYNNYSITEAAIKTDAEGKTLFTAKVKNVSTARVDGGLVDVILVDKSGNKVSKLPTYIRPLDAGEVMDVNATIEKDLSNAYNFYFDVHQN